MQRYGSNGGVGTRQVLRRVSGLAAVLAVAACCRVPAVAADEVSWEAEAAVKTNMKTLGPYRPGADEARQRLSGGEWLNGNYAAGEQLFAEYQISVPKAAAYEFFVRKFWQHGPFQYRFDDGDWVRVDRELRLQPEPVVLQESVPLCWAKLGDLKLAAGRHRFEIELLKVPGYRFDTAYGFDCFRLAEAPPVLPAAADATPAPAAPDAVAATLPAPPEPGVLAEFTFDEAAPKTWVKKDDVRATIVSEGRPGRCLKLESAAGEGRFVYSPSVALAAAAADVGPRTVQIRFKYKTQMGAAARAAVFLLTSQPGHPPAWAMLQEGQDATARQSLELPPAGDWRDFTVSAAVSPEPQSLHLHFQLPPVEPGGSTLWVDTIRIRCDAEKQHAIRSDWKGNIIPRETGELVVEPASPEQLRAGKIEVTDENGVVIATIALQKGTARQAVPLPGRGFYQVAVEASYADGAVHRSTASAAVVGEPLPEEVRRASAYGIVAVSLPAELAVTAGARWNWVFAHLDTYGRGPDGALREQPKPAVPVSASPLSLHVAGGYFPQWLSAQPQQKGLFPPDDWGQYEALWRQWAQDHAAPYEAITVCNEPDAHWRGTDEDLVRFHSAAARGIKAGAPGRKVLGPCLYNLRTPYLKKLIGLGLLEHLDGLTIHPYVNGTPPEEEFIERVTELQDCLKSVGREGLPVHFTEFGWTSAAGTWQKPVDELTQARYAARSLALLSTTGIASAVYFCGSYYPANPGEAGFSVCHKDLTPKPAYPALAMALKSLAPLDTRGRWLKPSPDVNLVVHRKPAGGSLLVAWAATAGQELPVPGGVAAVRDMMGKALPPPRPGEPLPLGPSPIYIDSPGNLLSDMSELPRAYASVGGRIDLPPGNWELTLPPGFRQEREKLVVPLSCRLGNYLVYLRQGATTRAWPIEVGEPLAVRNLQLAWPAHSAVPVLQGECRAYTELAPGATAAFVCAGKRLGQATLAAVPAGARAALRIPLPDLAPGVEIKGSIEINGNAGGKELATAIPYAVTLLPCRAVAAGDRELAGEPEFASAAWAPFGGRNGQFDDASSLAPADCSATLRLGYSAGGLVLGVRVTDDEHLMSKAPEQMFLEDCLQIAFDVDADRPWQENNLGFGFNGHRVFEYGVALSSTDGTCRSWRWTAYDPVLKANDPQTGVVAKAARDRGQTCYTILFPWRSLGLAEAPPAGSSFGFALLVNDKDAARPRHGLALFNGIVTGKDPKDFGRIWFR